MSQIYLIRLSHGLAPNRSLKNRNINANCYEILLSFLLTVLAPKHFHRQLGGVTALSHFYRGQSNFLLS